MDELKDNVIEEIGTETSPVETPVDVIDAEGISVVATQVDQLLQDFDDLPADSSIRFDVYMKIYEKFYDGLNDAEKAVARLNLNIATLNAVDTFLRARDENGCRLIKQSKFGEQLTVLFDEEKKIREELNKVISVETALLDK